MYFCGIGSLSPNAVEVRVNGSAAAPSAVDVAGASVVAAASVAAAVVVATAAGSLVAVVS